MIKWLKSLFKPNKKSHIGSIGKKNSRVSKDEREYILELASLYTPKEVSEITGRALSTIYNLIRSTNGK